MYDNTTKVIQVTKMKKAAESERSVNRRLI